MMHGLRGPARPLLDVNKPRQDHGDVSRQPRQSPDQQPVGRPQQIDEEAERRKLLADMWRL